MNPKLEQKLTAYALDELSPEEKAAVEVEIAGDPDAQNFVAELRALGGELRKSLGKEPLPKNAARTRPQEKKDSWISMASYGAVAIAAVALVIALRFGYLRLKNGAETQPEQEAQHTEEAKEPEAQALRWELGEELKIPPNADTIVFQQGGVRIMSATEQVTGSYCAIANKQNMALIIEARQAPLVASQSGGGDPDASVKRDEDHLRLSATLETLHGSELTRVWLKRTPEFDFYCDLANSGDIVGEANKELPAETRISR